MADSSRDLTKIEKKLRKYLDKDRFKHTQGVMYTASCMAMVFGVDIFQAQLAGLLHDSAKCMSETKMKKLCKRNDIPMSDYEIRHPFILHAKLGAWVARVKYGVEDREVLQAIKWHTTGKSAMTDLEKIIYIADYIEPGRQKASRLPEIRKMAFQSLNETMYIILSDTLDYLKKSGKEIDPTTVSAYEYYCNLHNQE